MFLFVRVTERVLAHPLVTERRRFYIGASVQIITDLVELVATQVFRRIAVLLDMRSGQLDGFDLVIHMGHPRLVIEPLSVQAPATVEVLRVRQK